VAVPPGRDAEAVQEFGCWTADLVRMCEWLRACRIETVAMQATGVYWIPLYDQLRLHGLRVVVVNAQHTKNVPGRKTDVQEAQWLMKLHTYGLLPNSFQLEGEMEKVRTIWRLRDRHVKEAGRAVQHMQKALTKMNVQLANVISDISGATGLAIITAILAGERDLRTLAKLRDPRVRASEARVAKSLEGNWRPELLFVLQQELESYRTFQTKIAECDRQLQQHYANMQAKADPQQLVPVERDKRAHGNIPSGFDLREELYRVTGVDLTGIDGVNVLTAQTLLAEVGSDMSRFATEAHFVSYLNLSPNNKISGGKIVGREKRKSKNRAGAALRLAAGTLLNSDTYLGAQYRRLRTKLGAPKARKAMANRMARIVYRMLKYGEKYVDKGKEFYEHKYRQMQIRMLSKRATELGLQLTQSA
jgi:transposase